MEQKSQLVEDLNNPFPFEGDIREILSLGLEVNHIVILGKLLMKEPLPEHPKIGAWVQALHRKGYIDASFMVTNSGGELLNNLREGKTELKKELKSKISNIEEDFKRWWNTFPATDTFIHKGRRFVGSRSFKNSKDKCKMLLAKILSEGEYTIDQLVAALETEILMKKEQSVKKNENKMMYMKNTHAYLNQREFEGFIEASKKPVEETNDIGQTFSI